MIPIHLINQKLSLILPKLDQLRWIGSGVAVSLLLFNFPSDAATFTSRSRRLIELRDFYPLPQGVAVIADGKAITIADKGIVQSMIVNDANFVVDGSSALAHANSDIDIIGISNDFLSDIQFFSTLVGRFSVKAGESLNFNLNGSLSLLNSIDNPLLEGVSISEKTSIFLQDLTNRTRINVLEVSGGLNTNSIKTLKHDFFSFNLGEDVHLDNHLNTSSFQETTESLQTFFVGSFERKFQEDTELALIMVNQSCNYASNEVEVCVNVPEPGNNLAILILGLFGLYVIYFNKFR